MAPDYYSLMSSGSKKKEPRYTCLSEAKASHSQRMWAEVSSSAPHLLHNGLSDSPFRWRCLLRVLRPVRRPVTGLDCVLKKDRNLALVPKQGPSVTRTQCGQSASQYYELGWLLAVLNVIHSLAVCAGIRSNVSEAITMPTTTLNVCLLRRGCTATCYVGESAKLALLLLWLNTFLITLIVVLPCILISKKLFCQQMHLY